MKYCKLLAFAFLAICLMITASCDSDDDDDSGSDDDFDDDDDNDDDDGADDDLTDDDDNDDNDDNDDSDDDEGFNLVAGDCSDGIYMDGTYYQKIIGGNVGSDGTSVAVMPDGLRCIAATKGETIVLYQEEENGNWQPYCFSHFGTNPQLIADESGVLHMAYKSYIDENIWYANNAGGNWHEEPAFSDVNDFREMKLILTDDGIVHIALSDRATKAIYYGNNATGEWSFESLVEFPEQDYVPGFDLQVGAFGELYLAFAVDRVLIYGDNISGEFVWQAPYYNGEYPTLFVEPDGVVNLFFVKAAIDYIYFEYVWPGIPIPVIMYKYFVRYSTLIGDTWQVFLDAEGSNGTQKPIALKDDEGNAYLVFNVYDYPASARLATDQSGEWQYWDIGPEGSGVQSLSMDLGSAGNASVAYRDTTHDVLLLSSLNEGSVQLTGIDFEQSAMSCSLLNQLPDGGYIQICFDEFDQTMSIARLSGDQWTFEPLDLLVAKLDWTAAVGNDSSIHLGLTKIDIKDIYSLYYQHNTGGEWQVEKVDTDTWGISHATLAMDDNGKAHLLYRCQINGVTYATNHNGEWDIVVLEQLSHWYGNNAIAVEPNGRAHLLYQERYTGDDVHYAVVDNGTPEIEIIYTDAYEITDQAIAVDSAGRPHVVFQTNKDGLYYATKSGGSWTYEKLVDGDYIDGVIAVDDNDNVHVCYYDEELYCMTEVNGVWQSKWIDVYGKNMTLVLDDEGSAHLSYHALNSVMYAVIDQSR